ncbi:MAG TPA: multidrug effflux MFS transporter [Euzebyales bacterium]|nr:multidrug effflux MFS transporter [Euzebyales bacterium]
MTTAISDGRRRVQRAEFTAVLAFSMALTALGIDLMLPAFGQIRGDLGLPSDSTAVAGLITAYFLGLAIGQLGYGPIADRFGRRPTMFAGYAVYGLAALVTALAPSLPLLLAGRFVWGLGAAAPRVVTLAMVRDAFEGEQMSRIMSLIMAVFILVPVVAPTLGAALVAVVSWRWLFGVCALVSMVLSVWAVRLPETLREEHRMQLRFRRVARAARVVVSNRQSVAYGLAMTALYGVFTSYLASAEIIFGEAFGRADIFPYLFGGIAAAMGVAMLANAWIVERVGTRRLGHIVLLTYVVMACGLVVMVEANDGRPPLAAFVLGVAAMLSAHALLIPNFNTIAMDPMAEVAGTASSVIGGVQVAVGALLGWQLDRAFDGTVTPISYGFLGYGLLALALVVWAERGRLFRPLTPSRRPAPEAVVVRP